MLMVRVDGSTREKIPLTRFHLAQSGKMWHPLRVKPGCYKLGRVELVDDVFHCGLGLRCIMDHRTLTALETVLSRCFRLIDCHFRVRPEQAGNREQLGLRPDPNRFPPEDA